MAEFFQSIGDFHFTGADTDIALIHAAIAGKYPPIVRSLVGYGMHRDDGVIIFQNGVWDIKSRVFTEKEDDTNSIFHSSDGRAFTVVDAAGNDIYKTVGQYAASVRNHTSTRPIPEIIKEMEELYTNDTGTAAAIMAMSVLGYMLHTGDAETHPMFFIRGVTGSGKSTLTSIMKKLFGVGENNSQSFKSTKFSMSNTLCNLNKMPLFISEFRDAKSGDTEDPKTSMFRNVFDRTLDAKGRPNLTIITYNYTAIPVFDAEECFADGALRSRCVQLQVKRSARGKRVASDAMLEWDPSDFVYSYMSKSDRKSYDAAYEEAKKIFSEPGLDPRIFDNIRRMYAGTVSVCPEMKSKATETIKFGEKDESIATLLGKFLDAQPDQ
jgi:hypothetical protein